MSTSSNSTAVEIRIKNADSSDFDRVRVVFPDRVEVDYGPVAKGQFSGFRATSRAYRYAEIHVDVGGRHVTLQPIDYAGEQELAPGRYTYVLRIEGSSLVIEVEKAE